MSWRTLNCETTRPPARRDRRVLLAAAEKPTIRNFIPPTCVDLPRLAAPTAKPTWYIVVFFTLIYTHGNGCTLYTYRPSHLAPQKGRERGRGRSDVGAAHGAHSRAGSLALHSPLATTHLLSPPTSSSLPFSWPCSEACAAHCSKM